LGGAPKNEGLSIKFVQASAGKPAATRKREGKGPVLLEKGTRKIRKKREGHLKVKRGEKRVNSVTTGT